VKPQEVEPSQQQTIVNFKNPKSYISDAQKIKKEAEKRLQEMKPIQFGQRKRRNQVK